jgi:hypothetical protein
MSRPFFQGTFPDRSVDCRLLSMVASVEPTTPSAAPTDLRAREIYPNDVSQHRCRRSAPPPPPALFAPFWPVSVFGSADICGYFMLDRPATATARASVKLRIVDTTVKRQKGARRCRQIGALPPRRGLLAASTASRARYARSTVAEDGGWGNTGLKTSGIQFVELSEEPDRSHRILKADGIWFSGKLTRSGCGMSLTTGARDYGRSYEHRARSRLLRALHCPMRLRRSGRRRPLHAS